jgi:integrase
VADGDHALGQADVLDFELDQFGRASALSTAARILAPAVDPKSAAAAVPMNCVTLSRLLTAPPATFGISQGRMRSLCSELRYVLRRLDVHEPDHRGASLVSEGLQASLAALPRFRQLALLDFLRFLDRNGITAEAVADDTLARYRTHCTERTLCADPARRTRKVLRAWNWAQKKVPGWPGKALTQPGRGDWYSDPLESYPLPFQQDLDRYMTRLEGRDIDHIFADNIFLHEEGSRSDRHRGLRASSIAGKRWIIRYAAAALVSKGFARVKLTSLRDLVHPVDTPQTILRFFLERRSGQLSALGAKVAQTLFLLARDYCNLPDHEVKQLADWAKRMKPPQRAGLTEKNLRRLRGLMQPRARAMLLCLPIELMRRAALRDTDPRAAARLAMYATAMEILLICPMRRGNLAGLRLDQHLYQPNPRRRSPTHILLSADEVKNDNAIHWPIPPESRKLIETYVKRYRPQLVEPGNPYLFGQGNGQRSAEHLSYWLSRYVPREIGVEFNVHLARHFAAWNFLQSNPGQYEVVRQVLGHRDIRVTIAYYVGLEADSSAKHFDATVLRDRHAVRRVAAHAFRKGVGGLGGRPRGSVR